MKSYIEQLRRKRRQQRRIARNRALLCLVVTVFALVVGATAMTANGSSGEKECIRIVVREGDTLWRLAEIHGEKGKDVRKQVEAIRTINRMPGSDIRAGDVLLIPVEASTSR